MIKKFTSKKIKNENKLKLSAFFFYNKTMPRTWKKYYEL